MFIDWHLFIAPLGILVFGLGAYFVLRAEYVKAERKLQVVKPPIAAERTIYEGPLVSTGAGYGAYIPVPMTPEDSASRNTSSKNVSYGASVKGGAGRVVQVSQSSDKTDEITKRR